MIAAAILPLPVCVGLRFLYGADTMSLAPYAFLASALLIGISIFGFLASGNPGARAIQPKACE